jgi:putative oxidoreductase
MQSNSTFKDIMLLLVRLVFAGSMLAGHGIGKLNKIFSGEPIRFGDPLGIGQEISLYMATGAEVLCASLIILGLFTRLATIPLMITMAVVVFIVKINKPFGDMELPLLYLAGFAMIFAFGAGWYSIDARRKTSW